MLEGGRFREGELRLAVQRWGRHSRCKGQGKETY